MTYLAEIVTRESFAVWLFESHVQGSLADRIY